MCLGIPGKILDIYQQNDLPMAKVEFGGIVKETCLAYTPEAKVGEYVIVHVGFAISQLDEDEAQETLRYIEEIEAAGRLDDELRAATDDPARPGGEVTP
jgi:hydrogenase expression/formation protein HypC